MIRRVQDDRYQAWVCPFREIPYICTHTPLGICRLPLFDCNIYMMYYNSYTTYISMLRLYGLNSSTDLVLVVPWNWSEKTDYDLKFVEEVNKRWNEFYE